MARPKGSKNKIKTPIIKEQETKAEVVGNKKNINLEIKRLKRLKLQCKPGSPERIDLHRQIKILREKVNTIIKDVSPEKLELIRKIEAKKPSYYKDLAIDLTIFTMEQLQSHYNLIMIRGNKI